MKRLNYILLFATIALISSCTGNKVYDKYNHTPLSGWEKNDTLSFDIPRMTEKGLYSANLGLRINGAYPFMGLTLIVEHTVFPGGKMMADTLNCKLIDKDGKVKGQGLSYYQYDFHINNMDLKQGDSLHITVRHDMKREILPGISDIGIQLSSDK